MAYGLRYQSDFYNYFSKLVSVKIYKKDYTDSVEDDIRVSEVIIESNYQDDNTPIIGTGAKIVIVADTTDMAYLEDMLLSYEKQFQCVIEYDSVVVFRGFSICDLNERQLLPYAMVTIEFTDYLKRTDGKYPDSLKDMGGMASVTELVNEMIGITELDLPLYVNSTLFEDSMNMTATDTFLPQVYVQKAQFYSNSYTYDNIYDALNKTLHPFSAFMYYYKDNWVIERQEDITRTGNWVKYSSAGAESVASLKDDYYKQGSAGEDYKYVDSSQVIEYNSGLNTLILRLRDKIKETVVYNDYTVDMLTVADETPDADALEKATWYRHEDITDLYVGTNYRKIEQYIKWTSDSYTKGLYYNFEIQFNTESDEDTQLTVSYKMSGEVDLTSVIAIQMHFYLRLDGGLHSGDYIYMADDGSHMNLSATPHFNFISINTKETKTVQWSGSITFNMSEPFATNTEIGLSLWEYLGYPKTQKFTIMFLPSVYVNSINVPNLIAINYLGDIQVSVNEGEIDNKIEYHLNQNFVKTDEIDLYLFDLDNINYSNGLVGSDKETLTNLWTSENSPIESPLYEVFAKCKFRKYGRTIHVLKAKILLDAVLKPFSTITDDNILNDSGEIITFLLNNFKWDLNAGMYEIEAEEYTEEEIIVAGVAYDSSGNPSEGVPDVPAGLALGQLTHRGVIIADWNPVGGAQGYKLQRKPYYASGMWNDAFIMPYTGTGATYQDPVELEGDPTGVTFTYKVCAYNAAGDSAYCADVTLIWT